MPRNKAEKTKKMTEEDVAALTSIAEELAKQAAMEVVQEMALTEGGGESISTIGMSHEAWLTARRQGIGSSDVGAILGLNKWKTPLNVYNEKLGLAGEEELNESMEFGIKLEGVIAETYAERTGNTVRRDDKIRFSAEYPYFLCNLDRIIIPKDGSKPGILEIKTVSREALRQWETEIPLSYYAQVQHQLFVSGMEWGEFAILVDGRYFRTFAFQRDDEYIKQQNEILVNFWEEHVKKEVPPKAKAKDLEGQPSEKQKVEADAEIAFSMGALFGMKAELKKMETEVEKLEEKIKEYMGTAEILTIEGVQVATWKTPAPRESIDLKQLRKEQPDVFEAYKLIKQDKRRFLVNPPKD